MGFQNHINRSNFSYDWETQAKLLRTATDLHFTILLYTGHYDCNIFFRTHCTHARPTSNFFAKFGDIVVIIDTHFSQSTNFYNKYLQFAIFARLLVFLWQNGRVYWKLSTLIDDIRTNQCCQPKKNLQKSSFCYNNCFTDTSFFKRTIRKWIFSKNYS